MEAICAERGYQRKSYETYDILWKDKIGIIVSIGEGVYFKNCIEEDVKFINDFTFKNLTLFLFVRTSKDSNLEHLVSESIIQCFMDCGYYENNNDRVVQYIGYSFKRSSIKNVLCGKPDNMGCAPYCTCHKPPSGPNYHVIHTKKSLINPSSRLFHFHYPNGTQEIVDWYGTSVYHSYIVYEGERIPEYTYLFDWGGDETFDILVEADMKISYASMHDYFKKYG